MYYKYIKYYIIIMKYLKFQYVIKVHIFYVVFFQSNIYNFCVPMYFQ